MEEIIMRDAEKLFLLFVLLRATYLNGCVMRLLEETLTKSMTISNQGAIKVYLRNGRISPNSLPVKN